jgi:hypothetical protein
LTFGLGIIILQGVSRRKSLAGVEKLKGLIKYQNALKSRFYKCYIYFKDFLK